MSQQKQAVSTGINVEAPFKGECCCRWQRVAVLCEWPQTLGQLFSEIDLAVSEGLEGMKVLNIKPRHWPFVLRDVGFLHDPRAGTA